MHQLSQTFRHSDIQEELMGLYLPEKPTFLEGGGAFQYLPSYFVAAGADDAEEDDRFKSSSFANQPDSSGLPVLQGEAR
jgi:hypothetical protein